MENKADLTPKQIVEQLDQYIIGQTNAKRAVAVALRNRTRRLKLSEDIRDEIAPKNILASLYHCILYLLIIFYNFVLLINM